MRRCLGHPALQLDSRLAVCVCGRYWADIIAHASRNWRHLLCPAAAVQAAGTREWEIGLACSAAAEDLRVQFVLQLDGTALYWMRCGYTHGVGWIVSSRYCSLVSRLSYSVNFWFTSRVLQDGARQLLYVPKVSDVRLQLCILGEYRIAVLACWCAV